MTTLDDYTCSGCGNNHAYCICDAVPARATTSTETQERSHVAGNGDTPLTPPDASPFDEPGYLEALETDLANGDPAADAPGAELPDEPGHVVLDDGNEAPDGDSPAMEPAAGWPVLDPTALYGLAGKIVAALEPDTEADPVAVLVSFLAGFGNAVNAGPHAIADGADHPARIHAVIVGATAKARKGTSWRRARRVLGHADPTWAAACILGGLSSGEGLITAVADPSIDKDGNPAGGVTDKRLLVVEEEFARVLTVARRESNILSAVMRQAWDDGRLRTMTKVPLVATGAHISLLGHVTVDELRTKLTETDQVNGFANRFLWLCARRRQLLPHGGLDTDDLYRDLGRDVATALDQARRRTIVSRTDAANRLWEQFYFTMADDDPGGLLGALIARAEAHVLRLSVIYALTDRAARVDVPHLEAAWALWRYCRDSVAYIFGDTIGDEIADRLLAAIRATPDGLDRTAQRDMFGRHVSGKRLAGARQLLVNRGLAREVTVDTGGRPRTVLIAATKAT